jgi:hypothetical protein
VNKFEDLPANVRALLLARLAIEMKINRCTSLHQLAKRQQTDVATSWGRICRIAKQPLCTVPEIGAPEMGTKRD